LDKISSDRLDIALAKFLIEPSSRCAVEMQRSARQMMFEARIKGDAQIEKMAREHMKDCMMLHDAVLTLESDPEIVKRNITARVISGAFPLLNTFEEFGSLEDKTLFELLTSTLGIVSEVATATQYLEGTRLSAMAHTERALLKLEDRFTELLMEREHGSRKELDGVERLMDGLRELDLPPRERPFIPLLLWTLISVISYRKLKEVL